ncbi:response regulator transcription factor [Pedobacter hartonius]|uniref:Two component transcriptional regulator, AraC family n=1 Tax=Pedobacter hartonius TaxID=425514 RepID=A0A1H4E7S1_9SPHI|nr:response regulator [Pedobacter hartonius]SEA80877.1 two component transcriptional regulator, AraC family [Pedobacter hartonius]
MKKPQILLIDDHEDMLTFLQNDLQADYSIYTAANGREALEIIRHHVIELIVSDVMMPEIDGFGLCRRIKSDLNYSHIPIILLTAKNTLKAKITGLELGADAYIEKPFSPEHLHVQIANLLSNRNKIKLHFETPAPVRSVSDLKDEDEKFLYKINLTIQSNLSNPNLDVDLLAELLNMSRSTLYRRVKMLSNQFPNELINLMRLKKSTELLEQGKLKIFEIAAKVGFSSQTHFGQSFLRQYGITPTQYMKQKNVNSTESS